jgi:formylglycine-generating enzyme required for sulfatase activity
MKQNPKSVAKPRRGTWLWLLVGGFAVVAFVAVAALGDRPWRPAPDGMVWIPGGEFQMGNDAGAEDEQPRHRVQLSGVWMDSYEVTNAQFAKFVDATNYVTISERQPDPAKYPDAKPENLVPGSAVFVRPEGDVDPFAPFDGPHPPWWKFVKGANWRHPEGPDSSIDGKENHPVVQIAWDDAVAYAKWAGKRLPTEAEWEYAARGGLDQKTFCWGDEMKPGGKCMANVWQGTFPTTNTVEDGFRLTAPVGSFPPNGFGLHDMAGNVWEWCADWYSSGYYWRSPLKNPPGPAEGSLGDDSGQMQRVRRGGSFLCAENYCRRYLPSARDKNPPDSSANHTGFRCVKDR